jgi:pimeloyl-ACP methyl ester carboxylesterase
LLLVHGGLDHSRSWDHLARALRRNFHVVAPDLRGHGESEWATGSSYSLADHVYDLMGLVKAAGFENVSIVGQSMGGMVSLTYAGAFPEEVSRLVVLDGVTNYPARRVKPADVRIAEWISDLDKLVQRKIRRYASVADGAESIEIVSARLPFSPAKAGGRRQSERRLESPHEGRLYDLHGKLSLAGHMEFPSGTPICQRIGLSDDVHRCALR